jgi:dihydrofolate reductase
VKKIVAGLFITLDGVIEAPEKWNPPYYDDELSRAVMPMIADAGTHLYGRRSYELFRSVFTGQDAPPHAGLMTDAPKVVVSSRPLDGPDWGPVTLISGDVTAGLSRLKQQSGGHISVGASGTLVKFLLQAGLLDELSLMVHPVVVGAGRHLFENGASPVPLALLESSAHRNGVVVLRYAYPGLPSRACASLMARSAAGRSCQPRTSVDLPGSSSL